MSTTRARRLAALLLTAAAVLFLGGCALSSPDELYALPRPSEEYVILQKLIDDEIAAGCEYSAPVSGSYTQIVHTVDLSGNGTAEAVAYLRDPGGRAKICVYEYSDGEYRLAQTIYGESGAISSVEYADMNGDGWLELIVSWQTPNGGDGRLNVYSLSDFSGSVLLSSSGTAFRLADMDGNGLYELLVLHTGGAEGCSVDMYSLGPGGMVQSSAKLSSGVTDVDRLRTGQLSDGVTALFAEGGYGENSIMTDIFIASDSGIRNITADEQSGASTTVREYAVYAADINNDRILEIPVAVPLDKYSEEAPAYYVFDWYAFDSVGGRKLVFSTYHCYSDGWFLVLPDAMRENLIVRREDDAFGEHAVVLSHRDPDTGETADVVTIYTLTGDNRSDRARLPERFILSEVSGAIYAAQLHDNAPYSREDISDGFDVILTEWNSGAL